MMSASRAWIACWVGTIAVLCTMHGAIAAQTPAVDDAAHAVDVKSAAAAIDRIVESALAAHGKAPNPPVDDATFLRRAYVTIAGRIPDLEATRAFLADRNPDKRSALVDALVMSKARASHTLHFWADLLRVKTRLVPQVSGEPYLAWLRQAIDENRPYDQMVRELLTAEGAAHAPGNGATGYYLRDRGMPEDNMANTVRVFLGTRIECAQCHDHPFDKWKQKDFYGMVAFTSGMQFRQDLRNSEEGQKLAEMGRRVRSELGPEAQRAFAVLTRAVVAGIHGGGTGVTKLPKDYRYPDAKPGQEVRATPLFGDPVNLPMPVANESPAADASPRERLRQRRAQRAARRGPPLDVNSRAAFAEWVTAPQNPRFAMVIANRLWQRIMGQGLFEPVDDIKDDTVASIPELMTHLEELIVQLDFDLREFERILLSTATFARQACTDELPEGQPFLFAGPRLGRLSAEQLWDSMLTLVLPDVDATIGRNSGQNRTGERYEEFFSMDDAQIEEQIQLLALRASDPEQFRRKVRERRNAEMADERAAQAEARRAAAPLLRDLRRAQRDGDMKREDQLMDQLEQQGLLGLLGDANRNLVRASELPSPAPDGHFLQQFGQSDREQIDGAHDAAAIPQALTLMNGFIEREVLRRDSAELMRAIRRAAKPRAQVETAYLSILQRAPRADELAMWTRDVEADGIDACRDLVWVLVNSHEFRFLR